MDTAMVPALPPDDKASVTLAHSIPFEANPDFNKEIDEQVGPIEIASITFRASQILHDLDPEGYRMALQDFQESKREEFKEVLYNQFPTPIAYPFYRAEHGYENDVQRLYFLRDVWESLVYILYALVVGESRCFLLPLKDVKVQNANLSMSHLFSDKISIRLEIITSLVELARIHRFDLMSLEIINDEIIQKLRELNRARNSFSHNGAISDEQARALFATYHDDVIEILQKVRPLRSIVFMRFAGPGRNALEYRFEEFAGHAMTRRYDFHQLSRDQVNTCASYLHPQNIIALHNERIYSVSPFLHFVTRNQGHETKLCFYKKRIGQDFLYEVVGESQQQPLPQTTFADEMRDLEGLLLPGTTRGHS